MQQQTFQHGEIRDSNDEIIQAGAYGKKSAFANSTNDGILDYIINNLEYLFSKVQSAISSIVGSNDTLTITNTDGTINTVTVDNVAHAGTADSLTYTMIPNGADLNNYYKVGEYVFVGDVNLSTLTNTPNGLTESFRLSVTKDVYYQQRLVTYNTHRVFCRRENMGWVEQPAGTAATATDITNSVITSTSFKQSGAVVSGADTDETSDINAMVQSRRTYAGSMYTSDKTWFDVISVRHRNGNDDGTRHGMRISTRMTDDHDSLHWNKQVYKNWGTEKIILDSANYNLYVPQLTGVGASGTWPISIAGNAVTADTCTGNSFTATTAEFGKSLSIVSGNEIKFDSSGYTNGGIVYVGWSDTQKSTKRINKWVFKNLGGEEADVQAKAFYSSNGGFYGNVHGNADTATKLKTARKITITGAVSGSATFDGSGDITINVT